MYLDCQTEEVRTIPFPADCALVIAEAGGKHALVQSFYNARREECATAADVLGVESLREVSPDHLELGGGALDPVIQRRAAHIVGENDRVWRAVDALEKNDAVSLGALLNASHESSRTNFENSSAELDELVELARSLPGVLGARLTGGGFGGAIIALVRRDEAERGEGRTGDASDVRFRLFCVRRCMDEIAGAAGRGARERAHDMNTTRRQFIKVSALAGGAVGAGLLTRIASGAETAGKPLNILILGGTGFTGPFQVKYALERGHKVTVFNRGKTRPGELPDGVEQLIGDRNGQLDALKGRKWDVAIDNPTSVPVWVRDAAQILQGNVDNYVFISTISVYADGKKPNAETDALAKYTGADAMKESRDSIIKSEFQLYGPLKALSEAEAEKWFPKKTLVIRPGLIVGPGDQTDRFTYWPVRIARGGEVLAPGNPDDPVQFIDARDLAEWTIRMVEKRASGIYNATGPEKALPVSEMLGGIKDALKSDAKFTWADADFLAAQKVSPWSDMPVWVPPSGEEGGLGRTSIAKALAAGLTFRSLDETARDTLAWFKTLPEERRKTLKAGLTPEREAEVLAAWHKDHV